MMRCDKTLRTAATLTRKSLEFGLVAAIVCCTALAGCGSTIDRIPTAMGGLPDNAPQRTENPGPSPAVFDAPQRETPTLTSTQQMDLEKDLSSARSRQQQLIDPSAASRAQQDLTESEMARDRAQDAGAQTKKPLRR